MKKLLISFARVVATEIVKLRGTFATWLTLLYPAGTVLLVTLFWLNRRSNKIINPDDFSKNLGDVASFFLPFFIVLLISVACNIEHKSSMMKHLLALPVPRPVMYLGKFAGIMLFASMGLILTILFAYLSMMVCGLIFPKLGFGDSFDHFLLTRKLLKAYFAAALIYPIQYWLGLSFRNLTLPVAIGSALTVLPVAILLILGISGLITKIENFTKIMTYDPYSYPYSSAFNMINTSEIVLLPLATLIYFTLSAIAMAAGAWEFGRRNVR